VLQRVTRACVSVDGEVVGRIDAGVLVLLGVLDGDDQTRAERLAEKVAHLRFFPDDGDRMNLSLLDVGGDALVVSQFTLAADGRKGRRPSFDRAAPPGVAEPLYRHFIAALEGRGVPCATGRFGARMAVDLTNDGPVTFVLDEEA
jgi:D-tyrosyl-tRNA(Tyr) deacylase